MMVVTVVYMTVVSETIGEVQLGVVLGALGVGLLVCLPFLIVSLTFGFVIWRIMSRLNSPLWLMATAQAFLPTLILSQVSAAYVRQLYRIESPSWGGMLQVNTNLLIAAALIGLFVAWRTYGTLR